MSVRIDAVFAKGRPAFVAYIMGGDPDLEASQRVMNALPGAGVDIIELGFPFTDPMADGPVIEEAGIRARQAGTTLSSVIDMARAFRTTDADTPVILMGYANPVYHMGYEDFAETAADAGVDGAIIVDLPPEEDGPVRAAMDANGLSLIRLATPTTDAARLPIVVSGSSGFVYYVSMTGVTGAALVSGGSVADQVARVRTAANLPVVVGFGVKTGERAAEIARDADGVVVGSAIVKALHEEGEDAALALVRELAAATHANRRNR
ncbi:tryptophan synthase subunit alpha [uncultured Algimonas sp.]|uniref:tryptophan synthase subunit alpha n=1 Tax=uncultured Algimonas sp. TaxID=1547920 RepID=UPI00261EC6D9|nr:tryptophan synthase subunit alpha [uncultured Algimonas sp.]